MKFKTYSTTIFAVAFAFLACSRALAQQPQASATPAPEVTNSQTIVYLKHEYAEQMKATGLFEEMKATGLFGGDKLIGDMYNYDGSFVTVSRGPTSVSVPTGFVVCIINKPRTASK